MKSKKSVSHFFKNLNYFLLRLNEKCRWKLKQILKMYANILHELNKVDNLTHQF